MLTLYNTLFSALSSNPALLLLGIVIIGVGLLLWKITSEMLKMFREHLTEIEKKFTEASQSVRSMASELNGLKNSLEKYSATAELRFEFIEQRLQNLEHPRE